MRTIFTFFRYLAFPLLRKLLAFRAAARLASRNVWIFAPLLFLLASQDNEVQAQTCPATTLPDPMRICMTYLTGADVTTPDASGRTFLSYYKYGLVARGWSGLFPGQTLTNTDVGGITGTSSPQLYAYWVTGGASQTSTVSKIDWHFSVPNGTYNVIVHTVSLTGPNTHVWDVILEGNNVDPGFDPGTYGGNNSTPVAIAKSYNNITVDGADLHFLLQGITNYPYICGLEIIPVSGLTGSGLAINKTNVTGCYSVNGASKASVAVEVAWTSAVGDISVSYGGQTKVIKTGHIPVIASGNQPGAKSGQIILSPQVVTFEVDLSSTTSGQTITAQMPLAPGCTATSSPVTLPAPCPPTPCANGQSGGVVFNDYNGNGVKDAGETSGVGNVSVTAYGNNGAILGSTTTDSYGNYVLTNLVAANYPIRIEFTNLPAWAKQGTVNGSNSRTTVQFVASPTCTLNLGLLDQEDFGGPPTFIPQVFVPCYLNGDPNDAGSTTEPALVGAPYNFTSFGDPVTSAKTVYATMPQVGALWGVAFNRSSGKLFSSAILKSHSGLGPLGLGGIYITDIPTKTTTPFLDVTTLGVNLGTVQSNSARGLGAKEQPNRDEDTFAKVGKVGMGGLDISSDGKTLYFINLFQKTLHRIDLSNPTAAPSVAIPNPGCINGESRPWALKIYKGYAYVGVICDASTSDNKADLRAYVYRCDLVTNTFESAPIFDFPLTYPKGIPVTLFNNKNRTGWYAWTDDPVKAFVAIDAYTQHSQPILSDIEFDIDGSMVLAFIDRHSMQVGNQNYSPIPGDNALYSNSNGGDVLRAAKIGDTFLLENNAKVGPITGYHPNNDQGPGFGEFYRDEMPSTGAHDDGANGALAIKLGSGDVLYTLTDPEGYNSGGVRKASNTTGNFTANLTVYQGNTGGLSKAVGLGDIELSITNPTFIEIGNRVWIDANKNGIQDPIEKILKDVNVTLYKGTTKIATTKTDANGEYYFSDKLKMGSAWVGTGADTTLLPNTGYKLVFGEGQLTGTQLTVAGLGQFELTLKDATANNGNDQNDSDAEIISGAFCINLTTGALGSVNHTFDAGFYCSNPVIGNKITQTAPTCTGTTENNNGKVTLTASITPYDKYRLKTGTGAWSGDTTYATATTIGATFPVDLVTTAPNAGATYVIRFYNGECCYKDTTITVAAVTCACTVPTRTVAATDPTCTTAGKIELTATNGDKYGVSKGATYTGPAYASATSVGTLPILIKGNISHAADSTWTIRVFNKDNTCFRDTTVTVRALVKDASVTVNNGFPACRTNGTAYTIKFTKSPAGGVVTAKNVATGAAIAVTGDSVANIPLTVASVRLIVTNGVCKDSVDVTAPVCNQPVGSIGDLIWKDVNDNGLQDLPAEKGVAGVKVNLYAASGGTKTGSVLQTKTTGTDGLYLFTGLLAGDYIVEIDKTTLPDTCALTTKQNIPSDDTKDSDFNPTTGLSKVVTLNPVFNPTTAAEILATNNLTVDAGLVKVCILPTRTVAATDPTCTTAGKIELTATNGDKYGVSKGATYTGPAYASATAVGTLPILIKGNISHAADSTWTIRVFNKDNTCFRDTTVTVKALVKDATVSVANGFPACRVNGTAYTIKFTKSPAGGVVTAKNVATGATIAVTGDSVANIPLTVASVRLIVTNGVCKDSVDVTAPVCNQPVGSIGDLIWKDSNDNGLQDLPAEKGVAGVKVNLYAAAGGTKTGSVLQTKTTGTDGLYLFTGLLAGSYIVEIDKTSLKDTCAITSKQNTGADDTKDSDFNPTTGLSQVVTLTPVFNPTTAAEILATNNLTVDAGLVKVCILPTRTVAATDPTCTTAGKIELTATNGDKYGVSKGATYTGPAYASATSVGTLPVLIRGNISHAADSTWTIRVFNKDNTCFSDTTVTVRALVKDASVTVNNGFPACRQNGTVYTIKFTKSPAGGVVTAKNVATGAAIAVTGDSVANIPLTVASVRLIVTNGVCKDSITVTAPVCDKPVGSIGDLIWKDVNDNGLQDLPTEKGVAGVKVNLYAASGGTKTGSVLQTKTTGSDGLYLFTGLLAGDYIVEIDKTSLKDTCAITTKQNTGGDDAKDSDFNPTTGLSQVVTLNPVFNPTTAAEILATNNLTVDAGLVRVCVKSTITTTAPVCSNNAQTYSFTFTVANKLGIVKVNKGTLSGSNPYTVSGIPSGQNVIIIDSLSAICKSDTIIAGVNCNCNPALPQLLTPSLTACIGDTFPTLKATVVGLATVEWFSQPTGGTVLATGLTYKPSGTATASTVFYAQARSTDPTCPTAVSTSRVPATINAQSCIDTVDLALKKLINTKIAQVGDVLTYTLKVWNESNKNATGVEVVDSIATTVQFVSGSFVASRGSATISGNVIKWTIGNIAAAGAPAAGDTVTLRYQVRATQEGLHFNTAEISKVDQKDKDSTPSNGKETEDDIDRQCFSVPFKLCPANQVEASVPAGYTNVQWFKNGGTTAVATGNVVLLSEIGTYTFTATNQTCPTGGCCPIIIEPGVNCCPEDLCVPFTIQKKKKR